MVGFPVDFPRFLEVALASDRAFPAGLLLAGVIERVRLETLTLEDL